MHNLIQASLLTAKLKDELDRAHEVPLVLRMLKTRQWLELRMRLQAVIDQAEHWHSSHQYYQSEELEQLIVAIHQAKQLLGITRGSSSFGSTGSIH
jgi:hypothetical protein